MEKYNDPKAMVLLSSFYNKGLHGFPVDQSKAFELLQRASELGCAGAHYHLGISYQMGEGTEIDLKKAVHHWQVAAMMGHMGARHNLGCAKLENGNCQSAMKHLMIAASCGSKNSLQSVTQGFRAGLVSKEDFEKTLRDYQAACDEAKSEQRDRAAVIKAARERE